MQVSAEVPAALNEQGLVDRFVGHLHLLPPRKHPFQIVADLLRRPVLPQSFLDHGNRASASLPSLGLQSRRSHRYRRTGSIHRYG